MLLTDHAGIVSILLIVVGACSARSPLLPIDDEDGVGATSSSDSCPDEVPVAGTSCPTGVSCLFEFCDTTGEPDVMATCDVMGWKVAVAMECADPCATLGVCGCFDRVDCAIVSEDCLCICDFQCPGHDPCDCDCSGGAFLSCEDI